MLALSGPVRAAPASLTMARYSELLRTHIVRAYDRADRGELWGERASAAERLSKLQGAVKAELLRAGMRPSLVATWSLYNSNIFNAAAVRRAENRDVAETPILVTLNCAPVDDGGSGITASAWTPDYVSSIVDALGAHGLWVPGLVPLVVEYRAVCPALLAASDAGLNRVDATCACGDGWMCGEYPEYQTPSHDRFLHARCLRTTHRAAKASWIRVNHAKSPATAAAVGYDAVEPGTYNGRVRADRVARAAPFVANGVLNLGAFHPGHDAYQKGEFIADNVASWALAAALVERFGAAPPWDLGKRRYCSS